MKSLLDLQPQNTPDIDAREFIEYTELDIEKLSWEKSLEDFTWAKQDIPLSSPSPLHLQGKSTAYFDALTSQTSRIFWLQEPLQFQWKEKSFSHFTKRYFQKIPSFFHPRKILSFNRHFTSPWLWTWIGLFLIVFSLLWLDKIFVENRVISGYQKILNIRQESSNLEELSKNINNARFDFLLADILFTPFRLLPHQDVRNGWHAISAGKYLTKSLDLGLSVYHKTEDFVQKKDIEDIYFTQLLENIAPKFQDIEKNLSISLSHYNSIKDIKDPRLQEELDSAKAKLQLLYGYISHLNSHYDAFLSLLGHHEIRQYLVVLQNADEIRPTWGFMGSMAVVDIFRWKIQDVEMRDVYSFEWDLKKSPYTRIPAPPWIDILTDTFGLRDANYFVNTADSSKNIRFFVENSWQDIDGIIYVNQNILLDFLKFTGGISFEPVGRIIDEKNFSELMSLLVEAKLFKVGSLWTPKQILFDFVDIYTSLLLEKKAYFEYLSLLSKHISGRDLMFYSFRLRENDFLEAMNLSGNRDYDQTLDFTYPVFTSLSGNKSDRYMERVYKKEFRENEDCSIDTTFTLGQRHTFDAEKERILLGEIEAFQIEDKNIINIQGKWKNFQFVRVLIPHEAEVQLWPDMHLVDYGARKWVEFYTSVEPTERKDVSFSYTLKNPDCRAYSFTLYKQPGISKYDVQIQNQKSKEIFPWVEKDFLYASPR